MLTGTKHTWHKNLRGADLTHAEYRVLITVSTYADAKGCRAHPGIDRLARDVCMDKRNVRRAIKSLIDKQWLTLARKGGNDVGYRMADEYELRIPDSLAKEGLTTPLNDAGESDGETETRGVDTAQGVLSVHRKGGLTTPPSITTSSNPKNASSATESRPHSAAASGSKQASPEPVPNPHSNYTWDDFIADFDAFEEWIDYWLGLDPVEMSTAHGMWENERHPKAIYNTIVARRRGVSA